MRLARRVTSRDPTFGPRVLAWRATAAVSSCVRDLVDPGKIWAAAGNEARGLADANEIVCFELDGIERTWLPLLPRCS